MTKMLKCFNLRVATGCVCNGKLFDELNSKKQWNFKKSAKIPLFLVRSSSLSSSHSGLRTSISLAKPTKCASYKTKILQRIRDMHDAE